MKPKVIDDCLEEFPFTVQMRFKSEDEARDFIAYWLDGGGEQGIDACTVWATEDGKEKSESSWSLDEPLLFVELEDGEDPEE